MVTQVVSGAFEDGRKKTAREWVTEHGKSKNKDAACPQ